MNKGTWSSDQRAPESAGFLKACGQEEDLLKVDYTSKQVDGLCKKYQTIAAEVSTLW